MIQEPPSKTWIVLIVAIISAAAVICAAIIGLGAPFAERVADEYYPRTTPSSNSVTPTESAYQVPNIIQPAIQPTQSPINSTAIPSLVENVNVGVERVILPQELVSGWTVDVWSNASGAKAQGGCVRLWRDLTWKGGQRDYIELCNEQRDFTGTDWNDQIKEVEVDCNSNESVTIILWQDGGFSGNQWEAFFCSQ